MVRDLDVAEPRVDGRRLEIVVDGLPLFSGAQFAVETTLVSPLHRKGTARRGAALRGEKVLEEARRRKELTHPEVSGAGSRAVGDPRRHSGREMVSGDGPSLSLRGHQNSCENG